MDNESSATKTELVSAVESESMAIATDHESKEIESTEKSKSKDHESKEIESTEKSKSKDHKSKEIESAQKLKSKEHLRNHLRKSKPFFNKYNKMKKTTPKDKRKEKYAATRSDLNLIILFFEAQESGYNSIASKLKKLVRLQDEELDLFPSLFAEWRMECVLLDKTLSSAVSPFPSAGDDSDSSFHSAESMLTKRRLGELLKDFFLTLQGEFTKRDTVLETISQEIAGVKSTISEVKVKLDSNTTSKSLGDKLFELKLSFASLNASLSTHLSRQDTQVILLQQQAKGILERLG